MEFTFSWSPPYVIVQLYTLKLGYLIFAIPTCQKREAYSRRELRILSAYIYTICIKLLYD